MYKVRFNFRYKVIVLICVQRFSCRHAIKIRKEKKIQQRLVSEMLTFGFKPDPWRRNVPVMNQKLFEI